MPDEKKPRPEEMSFVNLQGKVMGYLEKHYTRAISPAKIFLKIHVKVEKKEIVYDPFNPKDVKKIEEKHPDIYKVLQEYRPIFEEQEVNKEGEFSLEKVPRGWWCYIVCARVEEKVYDITQELGNNGFNEHKEISSEQLKSKQTIDSIVVPVKDVWEKDYLAPPKKDDPKMDPTKDFVPGVP